MNKANRMQPDANGKESTELLTAKVFIDVISRNIKDYFATSTLNSEEIMEFKKLFANETYPVFEEVAIDAILKEEFNMTGDAFKDVKFSSVN